MIVPKELNHLLQASHNNYVIRNDYENMYQI